jgi:hypothetical protein
VASTNFKEMFIIADFRFKLFLQSWRDSISRPVDSVSSVAGGDNTLDPTARACLDLDFLLKIKNNKLIKNLKLPDNNQTELELLINYFD